SSRDIGTGRVRMPRHFWNVTGSAGIAPGTWCGRIRRKALSMWDAATAWSNGGDTGLSSTTLNARYTAIQGYGKPGLWPASQAEITRRLLLTSWLALSPSRA